MNLSVRFSVHLSGRTGGDQGGHAFSEDGVTWGVSDDPPFTERVELDDGSSITYAARQVQVPAHLSALSALHCVPFTGGGGRVGWGVVWRGAYSWVRSQAINAAGKRPHATGRHVFMQV